QSDAELRQKVRAGMDRLYDYQHEGGGWGWWKTDDDHIFMTAYVLAGLGQAQAAGYEVKPEVITRAREALKTLNNSEPRLAADMRAYVAYAFALSGGAETSVTDAAWNARGSLTPYGTAVLGLAMKLAYDARAEQLASDLERSAKSVVRATWWESQLDWMLEFGGDDRAGATAFDLMLQVVWRK